MRAVIVFALIFLLESGIGSLFAAGFIFRSVGEPDQGRSAVMILIGESAGIRTRSFESHSRQHTIGLDSLAVDKENGQSQSGNSAGGHQKPAPRSEYGSRRTNLDCCGGLKPLDVAAD